VIPELPVLFFLFTLKTPPESFCRGFYNYHACHRGDLLLLSEREAPPEFSVLDSLRVALGAELLSEGAERTAGASAPDILPELRLPVSTCRSDLLLLSLFCEGLRYSEFGCGELGDDGADL
jgi:hypothetical protein